MSEDTTKNDAAVEETTTEAPAEETQAEATEAPAAEEAAPAADDSSDEGEEVEVPAKFQAIVTAIEEMSVLDLHELVKLFEKKFGVSAAAVAVAGGGGGEAAEEQTEFTVKLTSDGGSKIPVMKVVKELLGLGLKEAKEMVESAPVAVKEGIAKEEAEEIKTKLEEAGGQVELV